MRDQGATNNMSDTHHLYLTTVGTDTYVQNGVPCCTAARVAVSPTCMRMKSDEPKTHHTCTRGRRATDAHNERVHVATMRAQPLRTARQPSQALRAAGHTLHDNNYTHKREHACQARRQHVRASPARRVLNVDGVPHVWIITHRQLHDGAHKL